MRRLNAALVKKSVSELCIRANTELRTDILRVLKKSLKVERNKTAREILRAIIENAGIAKRERIALCQDTGLVSVYVELGRDVRIVGGELKKAITDGVKDGYRRGLLRKSVVGDPIKRKNTKTNTPCLIYIDVVKGNNLKITVSPKGFGSENKSVIKMLKPTEGQDAIIDFVVEAVKGAGPEACPPFILGIGIGSTFEGAAFLSKKALLRPINTRNPKRHFAGLEKRLLKTVNNLGIGPMGLGGRTTALGVNIAEGPTHIAGLPVAVSVGCHVTRNKSVTI